MKKIFIILGNQLFNPKYFEKYRDHVFFMAEDYGLCSFEKHHKHKILLFLSAMRSFNEEMKKLKFEIIYSKIEDENFRKSYEEKILNLKKKVNFLEVNMFEIEDKPFESKLKIFFSKLNVKLNFIQTPMFLCSRDEFKQYLNKNKKPFMATFYKIQRIKNNILVDENKKPLGGKWSFDGENRKRLPKNLSLPKKFFFTETDHTRFLKEIIDKQFTNNPGNSENFWLGTTRAEVWNFFDYFINEKLDLFGDYEDAVDKRDNILFHSALSSFINLGLITPSEILNRLKKIEKKIRINSYEGYVRQITGWREFIRGIYQNYNLKMEKNNFFNHERKFKSCWYNATTGLDPLDHSINNALNYGWTHHIERLMILSNIMNLCEIKPQFVYKWFMEMFVDSSEWVMVPNVYGMGLFSDGGIFATKPYICGSSYFLKMMDFKKGSWCEIMDGLYWRFISRNKNFFLTNPRLSMMVKILDKMNVERKKRILDKAENFIVKTTC